MRQVTFYFEMGKQGWTESWYLDTGASAARTEVLNYARTRLAMCSSRTTLEAVRISDVDVAGDSDFLTNRDLPIRIGQAPGVRDVTQVALVVRFETEARKRRIMHLRGLPDAWMVFNVNGVFAPPDDLVDRWQDFARVIGRTDTPWKIRVKPLEDDAPFKRISGVSIEDAGPFLPKITVAGVNAPQRGWLEIKGFKSSDLEELNGIHLVVDKGGLDSEHYVRSKTPINPGTGPLILGGLARHLVYAYAPVHAATMLRPGKRDTGRAFFVQAGRSLRNT